MVNERNMSVIKRLLLFMAGLIIVANSMLLTACSVETSTNGGGSSEIKNFSNFQSLSTVSYENINGKTVTVDLFKRDVDEALNNPNVGQGLLIYQCIRYKEKHPDEDVYLTCTSFHFSVVLAVCVDPNSPYFGYLRSLYDADYDSDGFYRLSYLLVWAAKIGINVIAIGQIDAVGVYQHGVYCGDYHFDEYFESHLDDDSSIPGKKVGDFLKFRKANWTSYGDKSASDMMHVKSCSVSNYLDFNGVEHTAGVWLGSINLDGIDSEGSNAGNNSVQTGVIISEHERIRRVVYNYTAIMADYCGQEEVTLFRNKINKMNTDQIDLILAGRENEIPLTEQIVYLGSKTDQVFEMYFTPIGGNAGAWDEKYNPYSKYIGKLNPNVSGGNSITFAWNNAKFLTNFEFSNTLTNTLIYAFTNNAHLGNKLYLHLPGLDQSFDNLVEGENISRKFVNDNLDIYYHNKDFQLSYVETGIRYYVSVLNSLNFHQGAIAYQTNTILVIKETRYTGNDFYVNFGKNVTSGVINENDRIAKIQVK